MNIIDLIRKNKFAILLVLLAILSFCFPDIYQDKLTNTSTEEQVDYRIRYSAVVLAIGLLLVYWSNISSKNNKLKVLYGLLIVDLSYLILRLLAMFIHGFDSNVQIIWLVIEAVIASIIYMFIKNNDHTND